jgi:hypothetical protein
MRNLLALIGLVVVVGGGAGWYLGWYKFSFSKGTEGNLQIKTDVDTKKVEDDSSTFFKKATSTIGNHIEQSAQDAKNSAPNGAPGGTPGPVVPAQGSTVLPPAPDAPNLPSIPVAPNTPSPAPGPINLVPPK